MAVHIIRRSENIVTKWSGGTTEELWIYPETAQFKQMDWLFRLSTATVEVEASVFTSLPGVVRTLVLLEGELQLDHEGHHSTLLQSFEHDTFKGDWNTTGKGKAVDFNLMTREHASGKVSIMQMKKGEEKLFFTAAKYVFLYLFSGSVRINADTLGAGDGVKGIGEKKWVISALDDSNVVVCTLSL